MSKNNNNSVTITTVVVMIKMSAPAVPNSDAERVLRACKDTYAA